MLSAKEIAQIASAVAVIMGQNAQTPTFENVKTSAKVKSVDPVSAMATKSKVSANDPNTIEIVLTPAMVENRMKLPRRMFGTKEIVKIDGNEFVQDGADQGRSLKFYPSVLGAKRAGQTMRFEFERQTKSARHYSVAIIGKGQKADESPAPSKAKAKSKTTKTKTVVASAPAKREVDPLAKKIRSAKNMTQLVEITGEIVVNNESKGIENENIKSSEFSQSFDFTDPRTYLPTAQSQAFRAMAKKFGVSLKKAIIMLNDEYELYA